MPRADEKLHLSVFGLHISLLRGIEINPRSVDDHVFRIHDLFIHDFIFMIYLSRFTHLRFAYRERYAVSHQNAERFPIIFSLPGENRDYFLKRKEKLTCGLIAFLELIDSLIKSRKINGVKHVSRNVMIIDMRCLGFL